MDLEPNTDAVWEENDRVRRVMSIKLKLGGQSAWSVSIASDDHPDIAAGLQRLARDFEYDGILELLGEGKE